MNMGQAMLAWMLVSQFGSPHWNYPVLLWVVVGVLAFVTLPSVTIWRKPAA